MGGGGGGGGGTVEGRFSGVVVEVGCADAVIFVVIYYGGLDYVEGDEVGDFPCCGVLCTFSMRRRKRFVSWNLPLQRKTRRLGLHLCVASNAQLLLW